MASKFWNRSPLPASRFPTSHLPLIRLFGISALSFFCVVLPVFPAAPGPAAKPNFLVILADDMGYSDAGCYGGEIQTPNLDRLAANGLRFTQFYNTARCWPTRACILTGYYAQQVRRDSLPGVRGGGQGKRPSWAKLLPELLTPLGYRSYHSGKWHVDGPVLAGGFHRSYSLNDHDRFHNPRQHTLDDKPLPAVGTNEGYYATTAIAQHAIAMLAEHAANHRAQPFFLYLAFTSPHFPLHALPQDIEVYRNRYRDGWDVLRRERFERMRKLGIIRSSPARSASMPLDSQPSTLNSFPDSDIVPSWNLPPEKLTAEIGPGEAARAVAWSRLTAQQQAFQPVKMAIHAAMVHRMDIEIGRVLEQLRKMGAWENTVILFASDNGASAEQIIRGDGHDPARAPGSPGTFLSLGPGWSSAANTPLRLHKSWVHEGGISTPLIVHWPAGIRDKGEWRRTPSHVIDVSPTLLELAGGKWPQFGSARPPNTLITPPLHHSIQLSAVPQPSTINSQPLQVPPPSGKSLVRVFQKDDLDLHDSLWWAHDGNRAIRIGNWKLVADHQKPWELYNISKDRGETHNLASKYPERVKRLEAAWISQAKAIRNVAGEARRATRSPLGSHLFSGPSTINHQPSSRKKP